VYDQLIQNTHLAATVIFALAALYLVAGMASPAIARAPGRGTVVLRSGLAMVFAFAIAVGVIIYTHMQPDGPHAIGTYIKDYDWEQHRTAPNEAPPAQAPQQ
jgi:hypothetical protein